MRKVFEVDDSLPKKKRYLSVEYVNVWLRNADVELIFP